MTNREKYAEQILDIVCDGKNIAIDRRTNNPEHCPGFPCQICLLNAPLGCERKRIKNWANAEYIEKPKISENDRRFLDYIPDEYKWMARDESRKLYAYNSKPRKDSIVLWFGDVGIPLLIDGQYKVSYPMIKWEDEEPWLIENLKKLEVE